DISIWLLGRTFLLGNNICGSKKTLASGVPMAQILFIGQPLGMIVLPIMIFHQIQLMVCGVIANYLAKSQD
uniref:bile acid:sodium symporter n=1 Tax=Acinetobacter baumannii TaxID=470 RepID=UPI0002BB9182